MRAKIGEMLYCFRIEKKLDAKAICAGVCSTSAMSSYEKGKRIPDVLLLERLMERMGIPVEEISVMVTETEYGYYLWRNQVYDAIEKEEWSQVNELLVVRSEERKDCNKVIEKQFHLYVEGICKGVENEFEEAINLFERAIKLTVPEMFDALKKKALLTSLELHILMLYLYYGVYGEKLDRDLAKDWFWDLEKYIYESKEYVSESVKCYTKTVCIGLRLFQNLIKERDQVRLCKNAIELLRGKKRFYDILEVLRFYIPLLEKRESREFLFYKKQYEVLKDIMQENGVNINFQLGNLNKSQPKVYLVNEFFLMKRKEKGVTQEVLSEGICEPETYCRIENGKQIPSQSKVKELAKELDLGWCFCKGELETYDLRAFEIRRLQRCAEIEGRRYDSLDLLDDLEERLDMSSVVNYQYITFARSVSKCRLGLISIEETCEIYLKLLNMTNKIEVDKGQLKYYSQTELEIIAHLAQLYRKQGLYEEGIKSCEMVIEQMKYSKLAYEQQWNGFAFLLGVLSNLYFAKEEYEKSIEIMKYVMKNDVARRNGSNLATRLDAIADNLEHMGKRYEEEYKKLYRYSYYVADFFQIERVIDVAKSYYESNFDKGITWYGN